MEFLSTHPYGVRLSLAILDILWGVFLSTHPYGVRLRPLAYMLSRLSISIHAPLRGATEGCRARKLLGAISIHAPLRGATRTRNNIKVSVTFLSTHPYGVRLSLAILDILWGVFLSTHPYGVRLRPLAYMLSRLSISIHAPLRGATEGCRARKLLGAISIHAPLRGATKVVTKTLESLLFLSTHPYGVRRFNYIEFCFNKIISIHAPLRGATLIVATF